MNRADRRARTEAVRKKRDRVWRAVMQIDPPLPGRAKRLSHFDCGHTQCWVCNGPKKKPIEPFDPTQVGQHNG